MNNTIKQMQTFADGLQQNIAKCVMKVENVKQEIHTQIANVKDDYKDRLQDLDRYYSESMEEMSGNIEQVRVMAKDSVNAKERELTDLMAKQIKSIQTFVDDNVTDMISERKAALQKYEKMFSQIKMVCCKYFDKYDTELETIKIKTSSVMEKYQDWSKVLIEPSSLNDARLFSLEARIHQEEEIRIKEFDFMKDCIKRLIYSFEQQNIGAIDDATVANDNQSKTNVDAFYQSQSCSVKKSGTAV
jgi:hypothetical protein